jgi:hypothetical protein
MAMSSATSEGTAADRTHYHAGAGDGVIGFDGCGAIDFTASSLTKELIETGPRVADRFRATLSANGAEPEIVMRRAVREFDFFYDYEFDTLIVSPKVLDDYRSWIEPSTRGLQPVTIRFGARSRPYFFGNLKHSNILKACRWEKSVFVTADTSRYHINQTRIGRHEVPLDHEVAYVARGQVFSDMSDYYKKRPSLHRHVAERLGFSFPQAGIINLGIGDTLISTRLFHALWSRPRPKSRVLGMTGSKPLVNVEFEQVLLDPPDP